jgi:uncharacterized protein YdeI (YjbR/CyaY-like superfamily)
MTEIRSKLPIIMFADQLAFEQWLAEQPCDSKGAWIKFAKKGSGIASVTKAEAIDSALCHGWIDGQLDKYDAKHWLIRFTPRKARSKWSKINRTRALELVAQGRMQSTGQAQIDAAIVDGRWEAAYAPASSAEVPDDLQIALDANRDAATFFATLSRVNRHAIIYRIGAVSKAETRARKIGDFVAMLARGETIHK